MLLISDSQKSPLVFNVDNDSVKNSSSRVNSILFKDVPISLELSSEQIQRNAALLYSHREVTVDNQGNLVPRSFFGRILSLSDSELAKVYETILATLKGIQEKELKCNKWTFRFCCIKPFQIGYDKLAMRILVNGYRYDHKHHKVLNAIEDTALEVLQGALEFRMKRPSGERLHDHLLINERV